MGQTLTEADFTHLQAFADAGDREGYYNYLIGTGDKYAKLALGVVREDTIAGRMANAFMAQQARQQGVRITQCGAKKISEELMKADLRARRDALGATLNYGPIQRYHEQVFQDNGLTRDAWTATAPLDVIGDHYDMWVYADSGQPLYTSANEARNYVWDTMLDKGFSGQSAVYGEMEKFAKPEGMWGQFDGYPLDQRASRWFFDLNEAAVNNIDYLSDDWSGGQATSPYPPCDPHELSPEDARKAGPGQGGKSAIRHSGKGGQIVCLAPDVCLTPIGSAMVPVPYMIISKLEWSDKTVSNTSFGGLEAFTMASRTSKVTGDEPGSGGGIRSGVNKGWCRPQSNKTSFTVKGHEVIQHDCICEMNCNGPNGPSNTLGKIRFIE